MGVAKNYIYNTLYQVVTLIMPLITVPYISRVLGKQGVGTNSYTVSIVQYFVLFGMVGINLYGNRAIATVRENKKKLSETFLGIYMMQVMTCSISLLCYIVFLIFFIKEDKVIFLIQSLYLFSAIIDISWLFMGLEQFKKTVTRNLIVKIVGLISVFIFVKSRNDVWLYSFILGVSMFLGQAIMWGYLKGIVHLVKIDKKMIFSHFLPSLVLFLPQVAVQVYTLLDKTMIGVIANKGEVGLYENSEKIVKMTLAIVTSLGTVMLPRISNTYAKGDKKKVSEYIAKSINFVSFLSIPIMFGIAGIAKEFSPWFFGKEFSNSSVIITTISPIVLFIAWSNVLGVQYMIPTAKNKQFTISVTAGAIVNFIFNLFLISKYQAVGAAISTTIAEATVVIVQFLSVRNELRVFNDVLEVVKYFICGIIMFVVVRVIGNLLGIGSVTTAVQIVTGFVVYFISVFIFRVKLISEIKNITKKRSLVT